MIGYVPGAPVGTFAGSHEDTTAIFRGDFAAGQRTRKAKAGRGSFATGQAHGR